MGNIIAASVNIKRKPMKKGKDQNVHVMGISVALYA